MPLVANSSLPTFERLLKEGETVIMRDVAVHQDIRELHIGILNMMPDSALAATERQFFRLVGESNQIAQFYMHPFTLQELPRSDEGQTYINEYYESFDDIKKQGLDALIITGANVSGTELSEQPFWDPLIEVIDWAYENVTSTICSCLATHAVLEFRYQQKRYPLDSKKWGVYSHRVTNRSHPLVKGVNTRFDVPHSRYNQIDYDQFEAAGLFVLAESNEANVHLAVSEDQFRLIFFQGHPEYDLISLLKEYKREVKRYSQNERNDYPSFPEHIFTLQSQASLIEYKNQIIRAKQNEDEMPMFPEGFISDKLDNTWHDTAEAIISNWIGKVYQLTNIDRKKPFQDNVNPENPLNL